MEDRVELTIAIPTYNRPEKVRQRLTELLGQLPSGVEVHIVDNASEVEVEKFIKLHFSEISLKKVRFTRNQTNIGLAGNICRCFEVAEGAWVWLLGDDDEVESDAVSGILEKVRAQELVDKNVAGYNFSTGIHSYSEDRFHPSLDAFWSSLRNPPEFSNALFLSSCVFRLAIYRQYLRFSYLQIGSYAPHLAVMMCALRDGCIWGNSAHKVVKWVAAQSKDQWSTFYVAAGLTSLVDVPGCSTAVMDNLGPGLALTLWRPFLAGGLGLILCSEKHTPRYWVMLLGKLANFLHGKDKVKALILLFVARLCLLVPIGRSFGAWLFRTCGLKSVDITAGIGRL